MSDNRENWEGVQNLKWGSQVYAKSRFGVSKNPKFSPGERGGDTPPSFDRTPPSAHDNPNPYLTLTLTLTLTLHAYIILTLT